MFCKEYQHIATVYDINGVVDYFLVYVELYGDNITSLPTNAEDIDNFPSSYDPSKVKFCPGSKLYDVAGDKYYLADTDNTFQEYTAH